MLLRVINYKFYLSPGYGLTLMKRKMSSACDRQKRGRYKGRNSSSSHPRARGRTFFTAKRDARDAVLMIRAREFSKIEAKSRLKIPDEKRRELKFAFTHSALCTGCYRFISQLFSIHRFDRARISGRIRRYSIFININICMITLI